MTRRLAILSLLAALLSVYPPLTAYSAFDRIRIVIMSSSDWTILRLKGSEYIANARGMPVSGSPVYWWDGNSLGVSQPLDDAMNGQTVEAQFDVVLWSEATSLIGLRAQKGTWAQSG
jgi:hypothetical protein